MLNHSAKTTTLLEYAGKSQKKQKSSSPSINTSGKSSKTAKVAKPRMALPMDKWSTGVKQHRQTNFQPAHY